MLIGTAGHIDHGKTALVAALTGRNTDRLPEEQRRGISIELGFAFLPAGESVIGLIDVPGHEAFLPAMLAGVGGISHALLVVAADAGVMPQTREHFAVLRLLGIEHGTVALSRCDRASSEQLAATRAQVTALLAGTAAARWPVFETAAVSGLGIAALRQHLLALARPRADDDRPARLAIDRVFTLAGRGTVVTGSLRAGTVRAGDELMLMPAGRPVRVRELRANDRASDAACAGERVALLVAGVERESMMRGDWLAAPGLSLTSARFDAWITAADITPEFATRLARGAALQAHHGTRAVAARVSALGPLSAAGLAVAIEAATPLALMRGDRLILREPSGARRLTAASVIDLAPPARGRRRAERLSWLQEQATLPAGAALAHWLDEQPLALATIAAAWPLRAAERDAVLAAALVSGRHAIGRAAWARWRERLLAAVDALHEREPGMPGIEPGRLARVAAPGLDAALLAEWTAQLVAEGALERRGAFLARPGFRAEFSAREAALWAAVEPQLAATPFAPPRVRDIARAMGAPEAEVRALFKSAVRLGRVAMVAHDHYFLSRALRDLAARVEALAATPAGARAATLRDAIGGGRKLAIQILEFFDAIGFTRRAGDEHRPRRANPWDAPV